MSNILLPENYVLSETTERCTAAIGAVYRPTKFHRPELVGTCSFVNFRDRCYVVTANHVLDEQRDSSLPIGNGDGELFFPTEDWDFNESIDIAIVDVTSQRSEFSHDPLFLSPQGPANEEYVVLAGYPISKNKSPMLYDNDQRTFHASVLGYFTRVDGTYDLELHGNNSVGLFAVKYETAQHTQGGIPTNGPHPKGMSGGIIVRPRLVDTSECQAIGVMHTKPTSAPVIIATMLRPYIEQIYNRDHG